MERKCCTDFSTCSPKISNVFAIHGERVSEKFLTCLRFMGNVLEIYGEQVRNLWGTCWKFIAKLMEIEYNRNAFGIGGCLG